MSKSDLLGSLVRAAVGVPVNRLGIFLDTVQKVSKANAWGQLAQFNKTVVAAAVAATFLTASYFVTNSEKKIWVSDEFTQRITSAYPHSIKVRGFQRVSDFQSESRDAKNIAEMGGEAEVRKHAFTPDQIARLIDLQPNGKEGQLLNGGYVNLFYVIGEGGAIFVVSVHWEDSDHFGWNVDAWVLHEEGRWGSASRVFYNTLELGA
jgi:hypothetical protein